MKKQPIYEISKKPYPELISEALIDETVPIIKTIVKTLYHRNFGDAINNYRESRFIQMQTRFASEEEKLSPSQIRDFYNNIDYQKLDLLFDLLDKARTTAYELHAKILSKFYGNFMRNGELNYHEKTLLANISILSDEDLLRFYNVLKNSGYNLQEAEIKKIKILYPVKTYTEYYIFQKLERVGLIVPYTTTGGATIGAPIENVLENKLFYIHNFTVEIYNFLDFIFEEDSLS